VLLRLSDDDVELDELKAAVEEGRLVLLPVERTLTSGERRYTLEEVVEEAGVERELVVRLWRALGTPEPEPDAAVFDEDLASLKDSKRFLDAGIPEDEFLSLTRTMSQALSGIAALIGTAFAGAFLREGDNEAELASGERLPSEELGSVAGRLAELAGDVAEPRCGW
jgi:Adenylate cyclase regulatory domain